MRTRTKPAVSLGVGGGSRDSNALWKTRNFKIQNDKRALNCFFILFAFSQVEMFDSSIKRVMDVSSLVYSTRVLGVGTEKVGVELRVVGAEALCHYGDVFHVNLFGAVDISVGVP